MKFHPMRGLPAFTVLAFLLPLPACFDDPADRMAEQRSSAPPPPELCTQFRDGLESLSARGAAHYQDDGTAVIDEHLWMGLGQVGRDKLIQMLAFHAACAAGAGSISQTIVVRDAFGNIMMRRNVDTRMNTMSMFQD